MFKRSLLLAGLALACAAPAASADSIVFIQGGNVAVAQPDGSGKVQLTDGGGWHSPTQADDGTIAAVNSANEIVVMAKDGRVIRKITTPSDVPSGNGGTFRGVPQQLAFSPNGQRLAYAYVDVSCPPASSCGTPQRSVLYTHVGSDQATPIATYGNQHSVSDPEWIDNERTLVFGGAYHHVNIDQLDAGDYNYENWFYEEGTDLGDGELSRSGDRLAVLEGYGPDTQIFFYFGAPTAKPSKACFTTEGDEQFHDPSWSPDSKSVAFGSKAGIEVLTFTSMKPLECGAEGPSKVVLPGATEPDWGPAEPAASRFVEKPQEVKKPAPQPPPQVTPPPPPPPPVVTTVTPSGAKKQRFLGTLSVGCTASVAGVCEAVATVKAGKKTYRSKVARKQVAAGEKVTLKLRFSKTAAAAIRKAAKRGKAKATVVLTVPGATAKQSVTLTK
jgi:hypothetical protein